MGSLSKDNPQGLMVVVICTVFTILAAASTILRLWSRRIKRARLRTNDYAILAALVGINSIYALGSKNMLTMNSFLL